MQRFKHILCLTRSDRQSDAALARSIDLAREHQSRLTVLEVIEEVRWQLRLLPGVDDAEAIEKRRREEHLQRLREKVADTGATDVAVKVVVGTRPIEELREAVRGDCDLVVARVAAETGVGRLFHGDAMRLLRKCPCPLWLERDPPARQLRRILVAVDVSHAYEPERCEANRILNHRLLELGLAQAIADDAELHLVHAWRNLGDSLINTVMTSVPDVDIEHCNAQFRDANRRALDELVRGVSAGGAADALDFAPPRIHLLEGSPSVEIPALVSRLRADLVVMGTVARTGIAGFLMGNTAEAIIDQLDCSLLALKPHDFVSPVS